MQKRWYKTGAPWILSLGLCYFLFAMPELCAKGVRDGIALCGNVVIPSLFLFLVLAQFWLESGLYKRAFRYLSPLTKILFRLPKEAGSVILMGLLGGYPLGSSMAAQLLRKEQISEEESGLLSMFVFFPGPAFSLFAVGLSMLQSLRAGLLLYASTVLSSLALAMVFSRLLVPKRTKEENKQNKLLKEAMPPISKAITLSIDKAKDSMLSICTWVIVFYAITACLSALQISQSSTLVWNCLLEVTVGLNAAVHHFPLPILAAVLSFGGLSVHCQILGNLQVCKVPYLHFLVSRLLCAMLSAFFCILLLKFFPFEMPVFSSNSSFVPAPYSISLPAFLSLLFLCLLFILELDRAREMC